MNLVKRLLVSHGLSPVSGFKIVTEDIVVN